jgi:hypothetical protein
MLARLDDALLLACIGERHREMHHAAVEGALW